MGQAIVDYKRVKTECADTLLGIEGVQAKKDKLGCTKERPSARNSKTYTEINGRVLGL